MDFTCDDVLIEEYRQYLFLADYSPNSIRTYIATLRQNCREKKIAEINDKNFFLDFKRNAKLAPTTIGSRIKIFKNFLRFLAEEKGLSIINIFSIRHKVPHSLPPEYLEINEIDAIRKISLKNIVALRSRVLFEFLLYTGCRVSEAINANWTDIDFSKNQLVITGKGNKKRIVYLGDSVSWIKKYLKERNDESEPLFVNQYKKRLWVRDAERRFKEMGEYIGLTKRLHPHMLRATFATHMIRGGVDARTLQCMLGHDDVKTTLKYYVGISQDHIKLQHEAFSMALR